MSADITRPQVRAWFVGLALLIGVVFGSHGGAEASLRKAPVWTQRFNGVGNGADFGRSVAVSPDGSKVFVTGESTGSELNLDYGTVAYEAATGLEVWTQHYNGPGNSYDYARSLAVSPDSSRVFVTGSSIGPGGYDDYATVAYDASTGQELWSRRFTGPGNSADFAYSIAVSPDGSKSFVTGFTSGWGTSFDYATIAYDTSTGQPIWMRRYNGPGNSEDDAYSVAVSPDGSKAFVTGSSFGSAESGTRFDYATIAYDTATGQPVWTRRYNGPANSDDEARAVGVSPDGSKAFVTGFGWGTFFDAVTIAYDANTGQPVWTRRYNGPANSDDYSYATSVSPDGSKAFVTGSSLGTRLNDYLTIAYDASTGQTLWTKRYNGPVDSDDFAYWVAVSADGSKTFVTGSSIGSVLNEDYLTIAYEAATGQALWVERYNGPGDSDDFAYGVAVSPDGSTAFVTGASLGSETGFDFATIAYPTA